MDSKECGGLLFYIYRCGPTASLLCSASLYLISFLHASQEHLVREGPAGPVLHSLLRVLLSGVVEGQCRGAVVAVDIARRCGAVAVARPSAVTQHPLPSLRALKIWRTVLVVPLT